MATTGQENRESPPGPGSPRGCKIPPRLADRRAASRSRFRGARRPGVPDPCSDMARIPLRVPVRELPGLAVMAFENGVGVDPAVGDDREPSRCRYAGG